VHDDAPTTGVSCGKQTMINEPRQITEGGHR